MAHMLVAKSNLQSVRIFKHIACLPSAVCFNMVYATAQRTLQSLGVVAVVSQADFTVRFRVRAICYIETYFRLDSVRGTVIWDCSVTLRIACV